MEGQERGAKLSDPSQALEGRGIDESHDHRLGPIVVIKGDSVMERVVISPLTHSALSAAVLWSLIARCDSIQFSAEASQRSPSLPGLMGSGVSRI